MAEAPEFVDFEIDADFESAKEFGGGGYATVPIGNYIFTVENIQQRTFKSNNAGVVVTFKIAEGQDDDEAAKWTGSLVFGNYSLSDKALGRLKQFMMACGAPLDKFRASACMGAKIRGEIIHNTSDGDAGPDGQPREGRTFANLVNEKPFDLEASTEAPPPPPPITNKAANGKTTPAKSTAPAANTTRRA